MIEQRLLFKKEGRAKYISHLDLLHTMQRAFIRAGVSIRHTNGFNPHPYMSFALPLSVGQESCCELMDFGLTSDTPLETLPSLLNPVLQEGLTAVSAYNAERKLSELKWLRVFGRLLYPSGVPSGAAEKLRTLFDAPSIVVEKKGKKGLTEADIAPLISSIEFSISDPARLTVNAVIAAQNPSLNPALIVSAFQRLAPDLTPEAAFFKRMEVYDAEYNVFR